MARALGRTSTGNYVVETEDGGQVTTPVLPPGVEEPAVEPWSAAYADESKPPPPPADSEKPVWIRSDDGTLSQTSAALARAWRKGVISDEDAQAEMARPADPDLYVRTKDGQLRPLYGEDARLAREKKVDGLVSKAEARSELKPVYIRDEWGRVSMTNAGMAKAWGVDVIPDDEGQRLMEEQADDDGAVLVRNDDGEVVSMNAGEARRMGRMPLSADETDEYWADGKPTGPANPLRNPARAFQQMYMAQAAPVQPTSAEMVALQDFAASTPPGGPAPGAPATLAAEYGVPMPTTDRAQEFSGFRGDPAVQVRSGDGWSAGGGTTLGPQGATPAMPTSGAGGRQPALDTYFEQGASAPLAGAATQTPNTSEPRPLTTPDLGQKDLARAQTRAEDAIAAREGFEVAQAQARAAAMEGAQAQQEKLAVEVAQEEQARQAAVDAGLQRLDALNAEAAKPAGRVDPGRWWANKSTGAKIMLVLADALAGFGAGLQGRDSVSMVRAAIDQDIDLQERELERTERTRTRAVDNQRYLLAQTQQVYGDRVAAKLAAQAAAWSQAERRLSVFAAQAGVGEAGVRAKEELAKVSQAAAEAKQRLGLQLAQLHLAQRADAREERASQAALAAKQLGAAATTALASGGTVPLESLTPEQRKSAVQVAPGRVVMALDPEAAKELREKQGATMDVMRLMDRIQGLRKEFGGEALPTEAKGQLQGLLAELKVTANRARKLGALDNGTLEVLGAIYGEDATSFWPQVDAKIAAARVSAQDSYANSFATLTGRQYGPTLQPSAQ